VITPYAVSNGGTSSANRTGWTAGAGAEWALSRSLSLGVEYRHTDLGSQNWTLRNAVITTQVPTVTAPAGSSSGGALPSAALADSQRISWSNDAVSVRLNYRFGH
jgi:opacity protein-like surface antigen